MDIRKIKKLIDLVSETNISEIEIKEDKESIRIVLNRQSNNFSPNEQICAPKMQLLEANMLTTQENTKQEITETKYTVNSPMVGTVYLSSAPDTRNFVEIGQKVKVGETLCLIEAMKMYNKIEADRSGTLTARLIENAQPVEYNQPLFIIE